MLNLGSQCKAKQNKSETNFIIQLDTLYNLVPEKTITAYSEHNSHSVSLIKLQIFLDLQRTYVPVNSL